MFRFLPSPASLLHPRCLSQFRHPTSKPILLSPFLSMFLCSYTDLKLFSEAVSGIGSRFTSVLLNHLFLHKASAPKGRAAEACAPCRGYGPPHGLVLDLSKFLLPDSRSLNQVDRPAPPCTCVPYGAWSAYDLAHNHPLNLPVGQL